MPDFHQPGSVLSLPLLAAETDQLEADLTTWTRDRPLAVLMPCHVRDLDSPSLTEITRTLGTIPWVARVTVGLDGADHALLASAREKFAGLPQPCDIVRNDPAAPGKGRNLRNAAPHLLRQPDLFAVAMHDCDIRTYSRGFLARLCWPVLHPDAGLRACKGYYARTAGRLHGRLFRLMFQPFLRAWSDRFPGHPWPAFLRSLRYPLSGELCVRSSLLGGMEFDDGWGVEVSLLHSLYQTAGPGVICQAELCPAYDHKHQDASGLTVMAADVARTLRLTMAREGMVPDDAAWQDILARTDRGIAAALRDSALMARMNGMEFDADAETALTAQFQDALRRSGCDRLVM